MCIVCVLCVYIMCCVCVLCVYINHVYIVCCVCAMCRDLESGDSTALVCESSAQTVTSLSHGKQVSQ